MHAWRSSRQAAAFAAVEKAGLRKSDIARIAGVHRSQVSRWVSGEQQPGYDRAMRLAAHLRREHPELADELTAAAGYGPPGEEEPDVLPEGLRDAIREAIPDSRRAAVVERLVEAALLEGGSPPRRRRAAPLPARLPPGSARTRWRRSPG